MFFFSSNSPFLAVW